ncbi:hypothetical protein [Chitinophaga sp. LS1]|uniref:hypothetical protein n=1 Tax=Chitinophaga sp. LS1 TaxID=3051176 RepID=UPI002AAC0FCB|nr:hypothetical protein [Chitinophaga sp. LS1]WPV65280.1 hypothetical protein QQL36_26085 [Chitinophaga sp. LS1]
MFVKSLFTALVSFALCNSISAIPAFHSLRDTLPTTPTDTVPAAVYTPSAPAAVAVSDDDDDTKSVLTPLLSYNFSSGKNNLSNLTPVINYGWIKTIGKAFWGRAKWELAINPYSAGQIDVKDSANYLPALMLPGIAGININNFFTFNENGNGHFILYPVNFALKLNTNFQDSGRIIAQYNVRCGMGFRYDDHFQIGIQHTWAWHNLTSESEESFKKVFNTEKSRISYVTVVFETYFNTSHEANTDVDGNDKSNVLFLEWRCLTNRNDFKGFPNDRILTLGFRKTLNLSNLSLAPGAAARSRNAAR